MGSSDNIDRRSVLGASVLASRRNALGGMIRQACQDVGEPSRWIDTVECGGRDEGVDRNRTPAAIIGAGGNRVACPIEQDLLSRGRCFSFTFRNDRS
jgi:hypothetical protein